MTRGPSPLGFLSVTNDVRTLAYFSFRLGNGDVFLRISNGFGESPRRGTCRREGGIQRSRQADACSRTACRMPGGGRALRPIFIVCLADGTWRTLGDDCGGRPREWVDERRLVIERFARLNSIALIDTETGDQHELLESAERSVSKSAVVAGSTVDRVRCLASGRTGQCVCCSVPGQADSRVRVGGGGSLSEPSLLVCGRPAAVLHAHGHEPDGSQRRSCAAFRLRIGLVEGEPIAVYASTEMLMPAYTARHGAYRHTRSDHPRARRLQGRRVADGTRSIVVRAA